MGWFDNDYSIVLAVQAQGIVGAEYMQDFKKNMALESALTSNMSMNDSIKKFRKNGFHNRIHQFHRRQQRTPHLLKLTVYNTFGYFNVEDIILGIEEDTGDSNVSIIDFRSSDYFATWDAYKVLDDQYGFDYETRRINTPPGGWGGFPPDTSECYFQSAYIDNNELVLEYYLKEQDSGELDSMGNPIPGRRREDEYRIAGYTEPPEENIFVFARYHLPNEPENPKYWLYNATQGTNSHINQSAIKDINDPYTPVLVLRNYYADLDSVITEEEKRKLNNTLDLIGLNFDDLHNAVLSEENGNDPSQYEDVVFSLAPSILDRSDAAIKYFIAYFKKLESLQTMNREKYEDYLETVRNGNKANLLNSVAFYNVEGNISARIHFNFIETTVEPISAFLAHTTSTKYQRIVHTLPPEDESVQVFGTKHTFEKTYISFNRKISDTEMECVRVHGLIYFHRVWDGPRGDIEGSRGLILTLSDAQDSTETGDATQNSNMRLPLNMEVFQKSLTFFEQADLGQRAMQISVYAVDVQEVKWYEKNAFKVVLQVIIIVVSVISQQYQNIGWALALEIAANILINIIISRILSWGFEVVFNILGIENTFIATAIIVAAAFYAGMDFDIGAMNVDTLMVVDAAISGAQKFVKNEMQDLQQDYLSDVAEYEKEMDALADIYRELTYNPFGEIALNSIANEKMYTETPESFMGRTLNRNPGESIITYINNFTETMLSLPKYRDTDLLSESTGNAYE